MNYSLPNVSITHFSKTTPYDGDFSTLFIIFSSLVSIKKPILLTKKHQFNTIIELQDDEFLKRAVEAYFVNGGDRLYLLFPKFNNKKFNLDKFDNYLIKECDRLNDIEIISAINLFNEEIYPNILSIKQILEIQRVINNYCSNTHKISITDIDSNFNEKYLNIIGRTVIYYPQIIDSYNKSLPPSIYASAIFSKMANENRYFESIANKEILNTVDVDLRLKNYELENLVRNHINPVIFIPHRGVRFWGVKSFDEKLDTINEVRVLKYIKRKIIKMSRVYIFEPNTIFLEAQIILMVKVFLEKLENIGALISYNVERNDESLIQDNEIIIDIEVALASPVEFINIRLNKLDKDELVEIV